MLCYLAVAELADCESRQPWLLPPAGSAPEPLRRRLQEGLRLREALRFRPGLSTDLVEQLAAFMAVLERTDLSAAEVPAFTKAFLARLGSTLAAVRERGEAREEDLHAWAKLARAVTS